MVASISQPLSVKLEDVGRTLAVDEYDVPGLLAVAGFVMKLAVDRVGG